ncbi:MAG: HAMP domain-containing sensor histidine kinase [Bacillota bacterium]|nr:HAMP domain-containing sensor histidine kinase [Bacillota bacterium]
MSEQEKRAGRKRAFRSALSRRLLLQYLAAMLGFTAGFLLLVVLAWMLCTWVTWAADNPLYWFLIWIQERLVFWVAVILLGGWGLITYRHITRPLNYLDELVTASRQMTLSAELPIVLPEALQDVQNELNLVREQGLRNAMAAKEAEQRKNDLIVYLAHDLKTPLTSVVGYLTLLSEEKELSPELRAKYTGISLEKALRLEDLINEFFDITRFSLTRLSLEPERVNLTRMLEQLTYEFNPLLAEKGLHWELELEPEVTLLCDPGKLERVFDNLIRNALSYSYPDSGISLSLSREGYQAVLRVKNRGRTIPPEKLSRIFEQFYRLDPSRSTGTGGAGLGLAIAREIVELHGGSVFAESAGESILFTVKLPCKPASAPDERKP